MSKIDLVLGAPETDATDLWLRSINQPASGIAVAPVPDDGALVRTTTRILDALGKKHALPGESDTPKFDPIWMQCWLVALEIREVTLYRAHLLRPQTLSELRATAEALDFDLHLVATPECCPTPAIQAQLKGLPATSWKTYQRSRQDLVGSAPQATDAPDLATQADWRDEFIEVAAPFYRASLRQLSEPVRDRLDRLYCQTAVSADDFLAARREEAEIVNWLAQQMVRRTTGDQVTILRATQCAAMLHGLNLEVDLQQALRRLTAVAERPRFEGTVAATLMHYRNPLIAAFAAVTMHPEMDAKQALELHVEALEQDRQGWMVRAGSRRLRLPRAASTGLAAYSCWREQQPVGRSSALWLTVDGKPISPVVVQRMLAGISRACGAAFSSLYPLDRARWQWRYGINLQRIAA